MAIRSLSPDGCFEFLPTTEKTHEPMLIINEPRKGFKRLMEVLEQLKIEREQKEQLPIENVDRLRLEYKTEIIVALALSRNMGRLGLNTLAAELERVSKIRKQDFDAGVYEDAKMSAIDILGIEL